ncbi:MAG TPA: hypothetical protein VD994_05980 [Prosthecobacter sp.]|nr:hypothetical protein [Prosthecobacter sp.]
MRLSDLTLMRSEGKQETRFYDVVAVRCRDLWLDRVKVCDNHSNSAAIAVRESTAPRISHCLVRNYMEVSVDDRTASEGYSYAFKCIDGTGISVSYSTSVLIEGNQVIEENLLPTQEVLAPNVDGGSIIANNIISDFRRGHAHWIWGNQGNPLRLNGGQQRVDPPLRDVLVQGDVVFHPAGMNLIQPIMCLRSGTRFGFPPKHGTCASPATSSFLGPKAFPTCPCHLEFRAVGPSAA